VSNKKLEVIRKLPPIKKNIPLLYNFQYFGLLGNGICIMLFALNNIYYLQGLHPYHVQRVQALQPNDYIRRQEFCEWLIQKCVNPPHFLRIVLFTDEAGFTRNDVFNSYDTHIRHKSGTMQQVLQGFGTIYIEGQRNVLEITIDILNNFSNTF
jgi:hypothetical protein